MTHPGPHLADEQLSALIDAQLAPEDEALTRAHLETCMDCRLRSRELRTVVGLLRALPSEEPPRDFQLPVRPRLVAVADPPNVIRLKRWYTVARTGAASLAAAFVFLSLGTLYVDSRSPTSTAFAPQPQVLTSAPGAAPKTAAESAPASGPTPAARSAAPAPAAPASAGGAASAARPQVASNSQSPAGDAADQTAAATSIQPLPTLIPTPQRILPTPAPAFSAPASAPATTVDAAAPLRMAAAVAGLLAVLGIFSAVLIRHRLKAVSQLRME